MNKQDEELCSRWMQLSAFFPFYRNHNTLSANSQEAYVWSSVIDATKTAMNIRLQLLPYMYTLFYLAHNTGSTVMRALAWEFPNDPSLAAADRQFFLGPAILVTPALDQGATSVNGVFPGVGKGDVYYDWYTLSPVTAATGQNVTIDAPLGHIPVYIRGNNVIPTQEPAMVTRDARKNPWGVIAALSPEGAASGSLYVDDGESLVQNATLYIEVSSCVPSKPMDSFSADIPLLAAPTLSRVPLPTPNPISFSQLLSLDIMISNSKNLVRRFLFRPLRVSERHIQRHQPPRQRYSLRRTAECSKCITKRHGCTKQ